VCIRAFPADSREYFGEIADGNTASPRAGAAVRFTAALPERAGGVVAPALVSELGGPADGAPVVPGAPAVGAALAPAPHSALRKSVHFIPPRVPADLAAWYLALHSFIVSACADETGAENRARPNTPRSTL
jgi:hypothetical protein